MGGDPPLRVPVGPDAHRWWTFPAERTVVVVTRTVTSTVRVLEVLPPLLRADRRVSVVFTHDPTSAFGDGVRRLLRSAGVRVMPWDQLAEVDCHLVITATENADLGDVTSPILVLPHGVGFHKQVPDSRADRRRLSGLVPPGLLEAGRTWLAVSHPDQADQLAAAEPRTVGRTLLLGDPWYDRLVASVRWRRRYRDALGLRPGQRLVVVSSTWGEQSLVGRWPDLPARLLAELPADRYRVALVTHPNVRSAHGEWEVVRRLADPADAGLLLVPPERGWHGTLVAADALVGDHGSVTLYGAALGIPLLLGAFGPEAVSGTPLAGLGRRVPRLDPRTGVRAQLERTIDEHRPGDQAELVGRTFALPGRALERLRSAVYRLLELDEPGAPPSVGAFPVPEPVVREVTSWVVLSRPAGSAGGPSAAREGGAPSARGERVPTEGVGGWDRVTVERFPAAVAGGLVEPPGAVRLLVTDEEEPDLRLAESAAAVVRGGDTRTVVAAVRWVREALAEHPGRRLAAAVASGLGLVGLRDGRVVEVAATGPLRDPALFCAVVHARLRAGLPLEGTVEVSVGERVVDVALRTRPGVAALPGGDLSRGTPGRAGPGRAGPGPH
ncbi:hypothetical protein [Wenjunlia vitaminophila]|uniref:hypothetical protein n=1 Tax=Wenjunlia vitaminophila TaxID=76728 RepID=UPI00037ED548|nr:hypothetical protein [Wenjunlia vitaminophila]